MQPLLLVLILISLVVYILYRHYDIEFFENPAIDAIDIEYHNHLNDTVKYSSIPLNGLEAATKSVIVEHQPYMENSVSIDTIAYPGGIENDPNRLNQIAYTRAKTICERVKSPDPSAFNNPEFNKFCGISFDTNGQTSIGNPHTGGGLYIDPEHKTSVPANGIYVPSLQGKSNTFAINKETAEFMQKDIACKKSRAIDPATSCSMCFSDDSFHALETKPTLTLSVIVLYTNATDIVLNNITLLKDGKGTRPWCSVSKISANETTYTVLTIYQNRLKEGDAITIQASHPDPTFPIVLAGYIQNSVKDNQYYNTDINALINRPNGATIGGSINGFMQYNKFYNNPSIILEGIMPFTFIPAGPDSQSCSNGPFITTVAGANFLITDNPCYGPGSKPGTYSLKCLQQLFLAAGGTTSGLGYPDDSAKAQILLLDSSDRHARSLTEIGQMLYAKSVLVSTGLVNGISATLQEWNTASVFLTGTPILNPCQTLIPGRPISRACLSHLYKNSKCVPQGTYNPDPALKNPIPTGLKEAQQKGNLEAATKFYESLQTTANNDALHNSERYDAFMGCYGITLKQK
jgi:hypothetical protein